MLEYTKHLQSISTPGPGNMSVAWVEPQWSQNYITLIGPSYGRVFVNTNMSSPVTQNVSEMKPGPIGANYSNRYSGVTPRRASYLLHLTSSPRLLPTQTCLLVMVSSYTTLQISVTSLPFRFCRRRLTRPPLLLLLRPLQQ